MSTNVHYIGKLTISDLRSQFPFQKQPPIAVSDFLTSVDGVFRENNIDLARDGVHEVCYAAKGMIDHNQKITAGGVTITDNNAHVNADLPDMNWNVFSTAGPASIQMFADNGPSRFQRIDVICTNPALTSSMQMLAENTAMILQGLRVHVTRSHFVKIDSAVECGYSIQIQVGDANLYPTGPVSLYKVRISNRRSPELTYSGDGGVNWQVIRAGTRAVSQAQATRSTTPEQGDGAGMYEALVMGNKLSISMGGWATPYVTDLVVDTHLSEDGQIVETIQTPVITGVRVAASSFSHFGLACHPTCFQAEALERSNPQSLGFAPHHSTPPYYLIYTPSEQALVNSGNPWTPAFPGTSTITVAQVTTGDPLATAPQYDLDIINPTAFIAYGVPYSYQTACLSRVVTKVNGIVETAPPLSVVIPLEDPPEISPDLIDASARPNPPPLHTLHEVQKFDLDGLTIRHDLQIVFGNFKGSDYLARATGILGSGNFAVKLELGHRHDPTQTLYSRFVGYCDTLDFDHPGQGLSTVTLTCSDQMQMMSEVQVAAPPNLDGYYHYYAMMYLCNLAGITRDQCRFYAVKRDGTLVLIEVPDDPFEADPHDPSPYFLPVGAGGQPWTPVNRTLPCLALADQVRKVTGFLQYVDNEGHMVYTPWIHPEWQDVAKAFTEVATDSPQITGGALTEIQSIHTRISTRNTRNVVATIGLDPFREGMPAILTKLSDNESIDAAPGHEPYNYVGWAKALIWTDTRFADVDFAKSTTRRMWNFLRQPEVITNAVVWPQYDLFVTYIATFEDSKCPASGLPMVIMGTDLLLDVSSGNLVQTEKIEARYLLTLDDGDLP